MKLPKLPKLNLSPRRKYFICAAIFLILSAALLTWFLQYRYFINNSARTWEFFWTKPLVFWYNALLVFFVLIFLTGLTRRPVVAVGSTWAFLIILTFIHINKFSVRGFPLLPEDFALASEASSLSKFIDIGELVRLIIAVLLVITLTVIVNAWVAKHFNLKAERQQKTWWRRYAIPSRAVMIVVSALCFITFTDFIRNHEGARYQDIPWLNSQLVAWDQVRNYDQNGFILGFLYNLQKLELTPPSGYTREEIAKIHSTYNQLAKASNPQKTDIADEDVNLIIILNESFYDPSVKFQGYSFEDFYPHTGGEILPNLHRIQSKYPSGTMYSLDYGGGTANIEFEALTGLTNYWVNTVPYTSLLPKATSTTPSIASFLKSKNYRTTAIHPFNGSMYKRNLALANLGYDTFITELEMTHTEKEGKSEYINDRSAYRQTLDVLNSTKDPQLITLITMQNHLPYNFDTYESTQFATSAVGIEEQHRSDISIYYQMLHNSDAYLGEFISELDKSDKKVAVLFFGDHSAGIFSLTNGSTVKEIRDLSRVTPYFIYTNYDAAAKTELPTTTPNCLTNTMFNLMNWQKPVFYYLLDDICTQTPILTPAWFEQNTPFESTQLAAYQLVTYDILGGKKYWTTN